MGFAWRPNDMKNTHFFTLSRTAEIVTIATAAATVFAILVPKQASSLGLLRGEVAGFTGTYHPCPGQLAG